MGNSPVSEVTREQFDAALERIDGTTEDHNTVRAYVDRLVAYIRQLEVELEQFHYGDDTGMLL